MRLLIKVVLRITCSALPALSLSLSLPLSPSVSPSLSTCVQKSLQFPPTHTLAHTRTHNWAHCQHTNNCCCCIFLPGLTWRYHKQANRKTNTNISETPHTNTYVYIYIYGTYICMYVCMFIGWIKSVKSVSFISESFRCWKSFIKIFVFIPCCLRL